jgi:hypothetical protein
MRVLPQWAGTWRFNALPQEHNRDSVRASTPQHPPILFVYAVAHNCPCEAWYAGVCGAHDPRFCYPRRRIPPRSSLTHAHHAIGHEPRNSGGNTLKCTQCGAQRLVCLSSLPFTCLFLRVASGVHSLRSFVSGVFVGACIDVSGPLRVGLPGASPVLSDWLLLGPASAVCMTFGARQPASGAPLRQC